MSIFTNTKIIDNIGSFYGYPAEEVTSERIKEGTRDLASFTVNRICYHIFREKLDQLKRTNTLVLKYSTFNAQYAGYISARKIILSGLSKILLNPHQDLKPLYELVAMLDPWVRISGNISISSSSKVIDPKKEFLSFFIDLSKKNMDDIFPFPDASTRNFHKQANFHSSSILTDNGSILVKIFSTLISHNRKLQGNPHLSDALATGLLTKPVEIDYSRKWDSVVESDIKDMVNLMPRAKLSNLISLRCLATPSPIAIACVNHRVNSTFIKYLLQNGFSLDSSSGHSTMSVREYIPYRITDSIRAKERYPNAPQHIKDDIQQELDLYQARSELL